MRELPSGWIWTTLGAIAELQGGIAKGNKRRSNEPVRPVPYLRVANVQRGFLDLSEVKEIEASEDQIARLNLLPGDVLFNEGGDRDKLGRGWVWSGELSECIHQNHVFRARSRPGLMDPKFLSYYGNSEAQHYFESNGKQTTNLASISLTTLTALPVVVPPYPEQRRIVTKLEELFSELDAGVEVLRRAQRRLARYRQSLLQAAVTGELTREWRDKHRNQLESPDTLRHALLRNRKSRWQSRNPEKSPDRYKPACEPREMAEADLPSAWIWVSFAQATDDISVGHVGPMSTRYTPSGTPFLRSQNVRPMRFSPDGLVFIDEAFHQDLSKSQLSGGELLVVRTGNVGDACAFPNNLGVANCADLVIAKPLPQLDPRYGAIFINSTTGRSALRLVKTGNAQPHFNIGAMERLGFPLPPLEEQQVILTELDHRLSAADALESTLQVSLRRSEHLRQSILERAFRGELVPQDPSDEPAEALLERLRQTSAKSPIPRRRGHPPKVETKTQEPPSPHRGGRPRRADKLASGASA